MWQELHTQKYIGNIKPHDIKYNNDGTVLRLFSKGGYLNFWRDAVIYRNKNNPNSYNYLVKYYDTNGIHSRSGNVDDTLYMKIQWLLRRVYALNDSYKPKNDSFNTIKHTLYIGGRKIDLDNMIDKENIPSELIDLFHSIYSL